MIGIDEVGRGAWAGPLLVVAARAFRELPLGLTDSKQLSAKKRELLNLEIIKTCELGEGWVEASEIDEIGLSAAMRLGVSRALKAIGARVDAEIIMDGPINYCPSEFSKVQTIVKADALHPVVSAASIYAKVTRDRQMKQLAKTHPLYGFEKNVGYGTALHISSLNAIGVCQQHRKSYKPITAFL